MDFSVYLYRVQPLREGTVPFEDVVTGIAAIPIGNRIRIVYRTELRLELARPARGGVIAFDITRLRFDHGPGRADRNAPVRGFNLADTEGFGEETAFLYDPALRILVAQYNHFGVRPGHAESYINTFVPQFQGDRVGAYEFLPILDLEAERRFRRFQNIRRVVFKIAASRATDEDRRLGASVEDALQINEMFRGDKVKIEVSCSAGNRRGLNRGVVHHLFGNLQRLDGEDVADLTVKGQDEHGNTEEIDLFAHRMKVSVRNVRERRGDRRVPFENRATALERVRQDKQPELRERFGA